MMKQMQEFSSRIIFVSGEPARIESLGFTRLGAWARRRIDHLVSNCRELLLTAAATVGITLVMLAASYIFFVQLAAHGW